MYAIALHNEVCEGGKLSRMTQISKTLVSREDSLCSSLVIWTVYKNGGRLLMIIAASTVRPPKTPRSSTHHVGAGGLPSPLPTPSHRRTRTSPHIRISNDVDPLNHPCGASSRPSTSLKDREDTPSNASVLSMASDRLPSIEELLAESNWLDAKEVLSYNCR
jgi:hypothetical protein